MHKYPALHNAMWPGLVGKGGPGAEPPIDLETMLDRTAAAQVNGTKFDGVETCSGPNRPFPCVRMIPYAAASLMVTVRFGSTVSSFAEYQPVP